MIVRVLVKDISRRPLRYIKEVLLSKLEDSSPHASQQIVSYWHYNDIWSGLISTWPVSPRVATCLAAWRGHVVGVMNVSCSRVTGGATRSPQRGQPKYFEWGSNLKAAKMGKTGQGAGKSWVEKRYLDKRNGGWLRRPCLCDAVSRVAGIYVLSAITRPTLPSHCTDPDGTFMLLTTHTHGDIAARHLVFSSKSSIFNISIIAP